MSKIKQVKFKKVFIDSESTFIKSPIKGNIIKVYHGGTIISFGEVKEVSYRKIVQRSWGGMIEKNRRINEQFVKLIPLEPETMLNKMPHFYFEENRCEYLKRAIIIDFKVFEKMLKEANKL